MSPRNDISESRGASASKRGLSTKLDSYLAHHRASYDVTVSRLWADKGQTLMTSLVVAIALALPALLLVALANLKQLGEVWDTEPRLSLYLNERAKPTAIDAFIADLEQDLRVQGLRYISADEALSEFESYSGFGSLLQGLDENPLPSTIEILLSPTYQSVESQKTLAAEWQAHALVDQASVDLQWVQRFIAITALARKLVLFLAVLLALGALLAIGNTVRLIIENRKDEIIVIKLVGGTNGFVRRPLLYTGGAYGFVGAVLAILLVQVALLLVAPAVNSLSESYGSSIGLEGLGFLASVQLLALGTGIGWLGAQFAVGRHLSAIEPR